MESRFYPRKKNISSNETTQKGNEMIRSLKEKEAFAYLTKLIKAQQDRRLKFVGTSEDFYAQKDEIECSNEIKLVSEQIARDHGYVFFP